MAITTRSGRGAATRLRPLLPGPDLDERALKCRTKFLRYFPTGFADETYVDRERGYKWDAYERWCAKLRRPMLRSLLDAGEFETIAKQAVAIESRTNLLFSVETMALRDAVRSKDSARAFSEGLWEFLHGRGGDRARFESWIEMLDALPRRQTNVLTWPLATVFGFLAQPEKHIFLKPMVTRRAATEYGFDFTFNARPNWETYVSVREFAEAVRDDHGDLCPRDMIDLQSFIWVQGSDEYDED